MTIRGLTSFLLAFALAASAAPARAQDPPPSGLRAEILTQFDDAAEKLVSLAEAIPQEKYGWRPAEGVRSISEVFMHVAGGNFFIPRAVGVTPPAGLSREMEKETDKAKVVETLESSIGHARNAIASTPDTRLDDEVELFGRKATVRSVFLLLDAHVHEHLGQSIAYARSVGVAPPWSGGGEG